MFSGEWGSGGFVGVGDDDAVLSLGRYVLGCGGVGRSKGHESKSQIVFGGDGGDVLLGHCFCGGFRPGRQRARRRNWGLLKNSEMVERNGGGWKQLCGFEVLAGVKILIILFVRW